MSSQTRERFDEIALPHLDAVYRMALRLCGNEPEADDVTQDTFVRAFRAFGQFELREYGARPWLFKILHNVFYTWKGKERRRPNLLRDVDFDSFADELDNLAADGTAGIDWDHCDEELKQAMASLQPDYREVILLWSVEGLSYKEIAQVCDCPLGTVMSRLYRARQILGQKLARYAEDQRLSRARSKG